MVIEQKGASHYLMKTLGTERKLYDLKTIRGSMPAHFAYFFSPLLCNINIKKMYMDGYSITIRHFTEVCLSYR